MNNMVCKILFTNGFIYFFMEICVGRIPCMSRSYPVYESVVS